MKKGFDYISANAREAYRMGYFQWVAAEIKNETVPEAGEVDELIPFVIGMVAGTVINIPLLFRSLGTSITNTFKRKTEI